MGSVGAYWKDVKAHKKKHESSSARRLRRKRSIGRKEQQTLAALPNKQDTIARGHRERQALAAAEEKKQKDLRAAATPYQRCWDWMIVSGHRHYARNRSSFKTYQRVTPLPGGQLIIGIGTVELEVVRSPTDPRTCTLLLEGVLHIPDAICNGICTPKFDVSEQWTCNGVQGYNGRTGEACYHGEMYLGLLNRLVLAGDPQGQSLIREKKEKDPDLVLSLSLYLSKEELAHFSTYGS